VTLATVLGNTTFTGYSATEEATMRAAITQLYNNSATARATFDKLGTTGSPASLDFTNQSDATFAFAGTGCPLYTSDAAADRQCVVLGRSRITK